MDKTQAHALAAFLAAADARDTLATAHDAGEATLSHYLLASRQARALHAIWMDLRNV